MSTQTLEFVASMTVCASDIRKIKKNLEIAQPKVDPIRNILVTPFFAGNETMLMMRDLADEGKRIMFDSGGYYVQTGKIGYDELFYPLLRIYQQNEWASVYVLPDDVPTSKDNPEIVNYKVENTYRTSELFFYEMPDELKSRAMPVVHGHNLKQVDACLKTYFKMGVKQIGFGSFGTMGSKQEVNVASQNSIDIARYVIQVAHQQGVKVHIFGLGVPAVTAMLKGIGADSFDSSSWLKAAGFGQVFLPFMRAYNVTYKFDTSELQRGITKTDFMRLKNITGHNCSFCETLDVLRDKKMSRAVHNLIVIAESTDMVNLLNVNDIASMYSAGSPKYRHEVQKWLRN